MLGARATVGLHSSDAGDTNDGGAGRRRMPSNAAIAALRITFLPPACLNFSRPDGTRALSRDSDPSPPMRGTSKFWAAYVGGIATFVYAVVTRVPFAVTAVYATRGLGFSDFDAIGSLIAFSVGRALSGVFLHGKGQPVLLTVFPSLTTIGYLMLAFLLPAFEDLDSRGTIKAWRCPSRTEPARSACDLCPAGQHTAGGATASADCVEWCSSAGQYLVFQFTGGPCHVDETLGDHGAPRPEYSTSAATVVFFYWLVSFLTGLSETVTALDFFVKREVSCLPLVEQQRAFRYMFVCTGVGAMVAYLSSYLYEVMGIRAVALCAAGVSILHTGLIVFYIASRGTGDGCDDDGAQELVQHDSLSHLERGNTEDVVACSGDTDISSSSGGAVMSIQTMEEAIVQLDQAWNRQLYWKLLLQLRAELHVATHVETVAAKTSTYDGSILVQQICDQTNNIAGVMMVAKSATDCPEPPLTSKSKDAPRPSLSPLPTNIEVACTSYVDYMEALLDYEGSFTYPDPQTLSISDLNASALSFPPHLKRQLRFMYGLTIFWLSAGGTSISVAIACFPIYWAEVWRATPKEAGILLACGELAGLIILFFTGVLMVQDKAENDECIEDEEQQIDCQERARMHTIDQPALQMWAAALIVYSSAILGLWKPSESAVKQRGLEYVAHLSAVICASAGNAILHSSGCENMVAYLPKDKFMPALRRGYGMKRVNNAVSAAIASILYSWSPQSPFIFVCLFYSIIYLPSMLWAFIVYFQQMPLQRLEQRRLLERAIVHDYQDKLADLRDYIRTVKVAKSKKASKSLKESSPQKRVSNQTLHHVTIENQDGDNTSPLPLLKSNSLQRKIRPPELRIDDNDTDCGLASRYSTMVSSRRKSRSQSARRLSLQYSAGGSVC